MSKEVIENSKTVENITKTQAIDAIKASKKEHDSSNHQPVMSIQNIVKDNTSEIIEKIDSKIPSYVQLYSELYKKYLHIANNFWSTSYLTQKQFLNRIGMDDSKFSLFETFSQAVKKMALFQIDMTENMFKTYISRRLSVLDYYEQMMNWNTSNFYNMFSQSNANKKSQS